MQHKREVGPPGFIRHWSSDAGGLSLRDDLGLDSPKGKVGNGGSGLRALTLNRVGRVAVFWRANRGRGLPQNNGV